VLPYFNNSASDDDSQTGSDDSAPVTAATEAEMEEEVEVLGDALPMLQAMAAGMTESASPFDDNAFASEADSATTTTTPIIVN